MSSSGRPQFEYIIFDLDETLYPREAGLMQVLSDRMLHYMTHHLGLPADDVTAKRRYYYQKYGTTLRGLMEESGVDPVDFLTYVHDVKLSDFLSASPPLDNMLREIPLRKVIFTNADAAHAERVLNTLRVRFHFEQIIDISATGYKNKPDPLAYQYVLALLEISGEQCIMVEDTPRNLLPAKDLGMTTILIDGNSDPSLGIDYTVPTIFHVGQVVKNLIPLEGLF
jgi:putative hydrolase of the HAD superfamily